MYFDYAATSLPKPKIVIDAVTNAMINFGNPSRGAYTSSLDALRCLTRARMKISEFFGAGNDYSVGFCQNATMALNMAIESIDGHIVTTAAEHNSVLRPIYRKGNYTIVPVSNKGKLDLDLLESSITPKTKAVVITHASNVTGNVYDISRVGEICNSKGVLLIVDAAQSAGLIPIDMSKMKISALCFSGHKSLYGPQGTGGICVKSDFPINPILVGGSGRDSFSKTAPELMPERIEAGTQNSHGIAGLLAGIKYVQPKQQDFLDKGLQLSNRFINGIEKMPFINIYGDIKSENRTPVVTINCEDIGSSELAYELFDRYGICVRAGAHCAPLMHDAMGTKDIGAVRFSFSHLNTQDEIDCALNALKEIYKDK